MNMRDPPSLGLGKGCLFKPHTNPRRWCVVLRGGQGGSELKASSRVQGLVRGSCAWSLSRAPGGTGVDYHSGDWRAELGTKAWNGGSEVWRLPASSAPGLS